MGPTSNFEVDVEAAKFSKTGGPRQYDLTITRESHGWCTGELTLPQLIAVRNKLNEFIDRKALEQEEA